MNNHCYYETITKKKRQRNRSFSPPTGGSFMKTTTRGITAFNFRWFQQPIRSCGIVEQPINVAAKIWPQWAQTWVSLYQAQLLAVAVRENVWEPLKLGLISGYINQIPKSEISLTANELFLFFTNILCLILSRHVLYKWRIYNIISLHMNSWTLLSILWRHFATKTIN